MATPINYRHRYNTRSKSYHQSGNPAYFTPQLRFHTPPLIPRHLSPIVSQLFANNTTGTTITTPASGTISSTATGTPLAGASNTSALPPLPGHVKPIDTTVTTASDTVVTTPGSVSTQEAVIIQPPPPGTVSFPLLANSSEATLPAQGTVANQPPLSGTVQLPPVVISSANTSTVNTGLTSASGLNITGPSIPDSTTCTSVIDLTVPKTAVAATSVAAAASTSVTNIYSGSVSSTSTGQDSAKNNTSKKMNFTIKLDKFHGNGTEDAKSWLMQFAQYSSCYGLDDATKANVFSFHLQDHARIWYNSLSESTRNNWTALEAAFKFRFIEDKDTLDLSILQISQSVNESVLEYLSKLQKSAALNPKVDENLLLAIAVNGLRSEIRQIVINKEPKNFADLRRYATTAEKSITSPISSIQSLHETMINEIQTLKNQIQTINSSMTSTQNVQSLPTVNQIMTDEDENDFYKFQNSQPSRYRPAQYVPRVVPQQQTRPNIYRQQTQQRNFQRYQTPNYNNYVPQPPPTRPTYRPQQINNTPTFHCPNCGDVSCNDRRFCRARSKRCNTCQRIGHFSSMCLAARPSK